METLIKKIRTFLGLSQTGFAERLNVTFASVNRWENGKALPNRLAQSKMYEICREGNVPVYDFTLERIRDAAEEINTGNGRVLLYHGSKSGIQGRIEPKSRPRCDFGRGFYMGTDPAQALTLICDYEQSKFYLVSVGMKDLSVTDVPVGIDWALLVAYYRGKMDIAKGTALYEKYSGMTQGSDLVTGSIADDRMFYVIDNFFAGNITDAALVNSLSALELGKQYAAISQKGCDAVKIEKEIEISFLERLYIKDVADNNRARGVSAADEICRKYRRSGLFFDEILGSAGTGEE